MGGPFEGIRTCGGIVALVTVAVIVIGGLVISHAVQNEKKKDKAAAQTCAHAQGSRPSAVRPMSWRPEQRVQIPRRSRYSEDRDRRSVDKAARRALFRGDVHIASSWSA